MGARAWVKWIFIDDGKITMCHKCNCLQYFRSCAFGVHIHITPLAFFLFLFVSVCCVFPFLHLIIPCSCFIFLFYTMHVAVRCAYNFFFVDFIRDSLMVFLVERSESPSMKNRSNIWLCDVAFRMCVKLWHDIECRTNANVIVVIRWMETKSMHDFSFVVTI